VPKKLNNDHLFIDTSQNQITSKLTVNDSETCVRFKDEAWSIPEISVLSLPIGEYRLRRKGRVREMRFQLLKEKRG